MDVIEFGESGSFTLPVGKEVTLKTNYPVEFEIITLAGSVIKATAMPNNPLKIKNGGDLRSINGNVLPYDSDI